MDIQALIDAGLPATEFTTDALSSRYNATFSRELTPSEWQTYLTLTDPAKARKNIAKSEAGLATALKTITPAQAVEYINTHVTNLASAKVVLKLMVRMLIALRDEVWPDMPEM